MTHVPQIPKSDNIYELATHASNIRHYQEHSVTEEVSHAVSTAALASVPVFFAIFVAAALIVKGMGL